MSFYLHLVPVEPDAAQAILERNVLNSQRVIAGDFESVLADVIQQLEAPPLSRGAPVTAVEMTKRIGAALREGLIGLAPNGFEFCTWLWDAAPLYVVYLGTRPMSGALHAAGVLQLRRLAAIVMHLYVEEQPRRLESIIQLLDSSVDWVDARQLIFYATLDHYLTNFEIHYQDLLALAYSPKPWRALVALEVGKEVIAERREYTGMALAFLTATQSQHDHAQLLHAVRLFVRSMLRYGDATALARYLNAHGETIGAPLLNVFCVESRRASVLLDDDVRSVLIALLRSRETTAAPPLADCIRETVSSLGVTE